MKRVVIQLLCVTSMTSMAFAGAPTTRPLTPQPPAVPRETTVTLNVQQPAFVPKFAKADLTPAGHFSERDQAYRYAAPIYFGYGYYPGGYFGCGVSGWGSSVTSFR